MRKKLLISTAALSAQDMPGGKSGGQSGATARAAHRWNVALRERVTRPRRATTWSSAYGGDRNQNRPVISLRSCLSVDYE